MSPALGTEELVQLLRAARAAAKKQRNFAEHIRKKFGEVESLGIARRRLTALDSGIRKIERSLGIEPGASLTPDRNHHRELH